MTYTRETLIKTIVAGEMAGCDGQKYKKNLKELYHKWSHESSEQLCKKYNEITSIRITVDALTP